MFNPYCFRNGYSLNLCFLSEITCIIAKFNIARLLIIHLGTSRWSDSSLQYCLFYGTLTNQWANEHFTYQVFLRIAFNHTPSNKERDFLIGHWIYVFKSQCLVFNHAYIRNAYIICRWRDGHTAKYFCIILEAQLTGLS